MPSLIVKCRELSNRMQISGDGKMETNKVAPTNNQLASFKSIEQTNVWLASQSNIVIKRMLVSTSGAGHKITDITFEYFVSAQPTNRKYQITEVDKTRLYLKSNPDKFRRKWQEKYPQYTFVTSVAKYWRISLFGGNAGFIRLINEKHIILYAFRCNH